ncbi:MAG: response regulator [Verrucomicrobiota bacterium]
MPTTGTGQKQRILIVDDERVTLQYHSSMLKSLGYECVTASSGAEAREILLRSSTRDFDCLVTDYLMQGETGLDLINWLREKSSSLAAIVITAQEERSLIAETLRTGAVDFLDKPVPKNALANAVKKACELTAKWRSLHANYDAVRELAKFKGILCSFRPVEGQSPPDLVFFPKFDLGGDFVNLYPLNTDQYVLLCGDVSGHDLKAAYISSYFQGIVRGLSEKKASASDIIHHFNKILINEWNETLFQERDLTSFSISVLLLFVDRLSQKIHLLNCGFPAPLMDDGKGQAYVLETSSQPLGWFETLVLSEKHFNLPEVGSITLYTDGVIDLAYALKVHPVSLAYRLLQEKDYSIQHKITQQAQDDVLIVRMNPHPHHQSQEIFGMILFQVLSPDDLVRIDHHQAEWERSLLYAMEEGIFGDRLYDVVVCIREAVLNGLSHGCRKVKNPTCALQISYNASSGILRIRVDDPGPGHDFNLLQSFDDLVQLKKSHLGLVMMKCLADSLTMENKGASVIVDFNFSLPS